MAHISFNERNKTIKVRGDISVSSLLEVLGGIEWDGWTLMPTASVLNDPDKIITMIELPEFNDEVIPPSPDGLPEEFPTINTHHTPDDGC